MPKLLRRTVRKGGGAALLIALQLITLTLLSLIGPMASGPKQANAPADSQQASVVQDQAQQAPGTDALQQQPFTATDLTAAEKAALRQSAHFGKKVYEPLASEIYNLVTTNAAAVTAARNEARQLNQPYDGATLTTDQSDYPPFSYVYFHGTGFQPGETVDMLVAETDPVQQSFDPWYVVADGNGEFDTSWYIYSEEFQGATFLATATGETSQETASATFTDASPSIQTYIAPAYAPQSTAQTFSFVVENTDANANNVVRNIKITLPDGFTGVTQAGITSSFSGGTWNTPVITGNGTSGNPFVITVATANPSPAPGLAANGGWARFDINATTSSSAHIADSGTTFNFNTVVSSSNTGTPAGGTGSLAVWVQNSPTTNPNTYTANFVRPKTTTLTGNITATQTLNIPVTSPSRIAANDVLLIDNEQLQVTAVNSGTLLNVTRQFNSTTNTIHNSGSLVDITTGLSANMNAVTTLSAAINNAQTSFNVASATNIAANDVLLIDNEQIKVISKSTNTLNEAA